MSNRPIASATANFGRKRSSQAELWPMSKPSMNCPVLGSVAILYDVWNMPHTIAKSVQPMTGQRQSSPFRRYVCHNSQAAVSGGKTVTYQHKSASSTACNQMNSAGLAKLASVQPNTYVPTKEAIHETAQNATP